MNNVQNPLIQIVTVEGKDDSTKNRLTITVHKDYQTPPYYTREYIATPSRAERIRALLENIYTGEMTSETTRTTYEHFKPRPQNAYTENGYKDRADYLETLAADFGIASSDVQSIADVLGESEDFDGLVSALEDYSDMSTFTQEFDDYTDADPGL